MYLRALSSASFRVNARATGAGISFLAILLNNKLCLFSLSIAPERLRKWVVLLFTTYYTAQGVL